MAVDVQVHAWDIALIRQAKIIRHGIDPREVTYLVGHLQVSQVSMEKILHLRHRTLARRQVAGKRLTTDESERVVRLGSVFRLATEVLGSADAARQWFQKARAELDGETPFQHCDTEPGRMDVERVLERIADGVFA